MVSVVVAVVLVDKRVPAGAIVCKQLLNASSCFLLPPSVMSKRRLSAAPLPPAKRFNKSYSKTAQNFDSILYDELVLVIFSYLSWSDLCTVQTINRHWARLASDNQVHTDLECKRTI